MELDLDENNVRNLQCYRILNLLKDCSDTQIKKAYRSAISVAHPDRGGSAEEAMLVNKAKTILLDKKKRADYNKVSTPSLVSDLRKKLTPCLHRLS